MLKLSIPNSNIFQCYNIFFFIFQGYIIIQSPVIILAQMQFRYFISTKPLGMDKMKDRICKEQII